MKNDSEKVTPGERFACQSVGPITETVTVLRLVKTAVSLGSTTV